jgi:hypothetical protein
MAKHAGGARDQAGQAAQGLLGKRSRHGGVSKGGSTQNNASAMPSSSY